MLNLAFGSGCPCSAPPCLSRLGSESCAIGLQAEKWKSDNKCSVGELWLQLLKFYCLEFDNTHLVISILQTEPMTRQEKKWHSKKLAIEGERQCMW